MKGRHNKGTPSTAKNIREEKQNSQRPRSQSKGSNIDLSPC